MRSHSFPASTPYQQCIADDPVFNPAVHLALGTPSDTLALSDLGYQQRPVNVPSDVALTTSFQLLSAEGVAALYHVCKQLEQFSTSNLRVERNVRGGVYRSTFLRDFALSVDVAEHLGNLLHTPLAPHGMPHQLAHINFQPLTPGKNVDKWHRDTLQVDYVLFVTDPNDVEGGEFQYFRGTYDEMSELQKLQQPVPHDRIVAPHIPGPGYAVLMQGDQVVHQARGIEAGERITLVNGYTWLKSEARDYSALGQLVNADAEPTVIAEYTRHMALRCQSRLQECVDYPDFNSGTEYHLRKLKTAKRELEDAIQKLQLLDKEEMQHFGD